MDAKLKTYMDRVKSNTPEGFPNLVAGWPREEFYRTVEGHLRCKDCGHEEVEHLSGTGFFVEDDFNTECVKCGSTNTHLQIVDDQEMSDELGFSWSTCDLCGALPGERCAVTALPENPRENHDYVPLRVCGDCLCYVANGDLPNFD